MEAQRHSWSWRALESFNNNQSCRFASILLHLVNLGGCGAGSDYTAKSTHKKGRNKLRRQKGWRLYRQQRGSVGEQTIARISINYPLTSRWFGWVGSSHSEANLKQQETLLCIFRQASKSGWCPNLFCFGMHASGNWSWNYNSLRDKTCNDMQSKHCLFYKMRVVCSYYPEDY